MPLEGHQFRGLVASVEALFVGVIHRRGGDVKEGRTQSWLVGLCLVFGAAMWAGQVAVATDLSGEMGDDTTDTRQEQEGGIEEICLLGDCPCATEDCIDVKPNHECTPGEDGCDDSWLDVAKVPCAEEEETCTADSAIPEPPSGDSGIEGDGLGDGMEGNAHNGGVYDLQIRVWIGEDVVDSAKPLLVERVEEELGQVGGYLADLDHDNLEDLDLEALMAHLEQLKKSLTLLKFTKSSLDVDVVYYRSSVKSMVAEGLGEIVQTHPYKRRLCRAVAAAGTGFRWRLGQRITTEQGLIWNRHLSPMVGGVIDTIRDEINEGIATHLDEQGMDEWVTLTLLEDRCRAAPATTLMEVVSLSDPPRFPPTVIDLSEILEAGEEGDIDFDDVFERITQILLDASQDNGS